MLKLNNSAAVYFKSLVNGQSVDKITEDIKKYTNSQKDVLNFTADDIKS